MLQPITEDTAIRLYPDIWAYSEDELEEIFISYVRIDNEIVGLFRDGSACIYTKV